VKAGTKSNEFLEPKKASLVEVACFRIDNAALSLKTKHLEQFPLNSNAWCVVNSA